MGLTQTIRKPHLKFNVEYTHGPHISSDWTRAAVLPASWELLAAREAVNLGSRHAFPETELRGGVKNHTPETQAQRGSKLRGRRGLPPVASQEVEGRVVPPAGVRAAPTSAAGPASPPRGPRLQHPRGLAFPAPQGLALSCGIGTDPGRPRGKVGFLAPTG